MKSVKYALIVVSVAVMSLFSGCYTQIATRDDGYSDGYENSDGYYDNEGNSSYDNNAYSGSDTTQYSDGTSITNNYYFGDGPYLSRRRFFSGYYPGISVSVTYGTSYYDPYWYGSGYFYDWYYSPYYYWPSSYFYWYPGYAWDYYGGYHHHHYDYGYDDGGKYKYRRGSDFTRLRDFGTGRGTTGRRTAVADDRRGGASSSQSVTRDSRTRVNDLNRRNARETATGGRTVPTGRRNDVLDRRGESRDTDPAVRNGSTRSSAAGRDGENTAVDKRPSPTVEKRPAPARNNVISKDENNRVNIPRDRRIYAPRPASSAPRENTSSQEPARREGVRQPRSENVAPGVQKPDTDNRRVEPRRERVQPRNERAEPESRRAEPRRSEPRSERPSYNPPPRPQQPSSGSQPRSSSGSSSSGSRSRGESSDRGRR